MTRPPERRPPDPPRIAALWVAALMALLGLLLLCNAWWPR